MSENIKKDQVVIAIPIYKDELSAEEQLSLDQCFRILSNFDIVFFAPKRLENCSYAEGRQVLYFDNNFFEGRTGYNRLTLSKAFYSKFRNYRYMLLYQLDAYVFRDELLDWCNKGYSYIGAPWLTGFNQDASKYNLWKTGNGGFSLRRIEDFIQVLSQPFKRVRSISKIKRNYRHLNAVKRNAVAIREFLARQNSLHHFVSLYSYNEDNFWSIYAHLFYPHFSILPPEEALAFAQECGGQYFYERRGKVLPFGCHAWQRYEPDFWAEFIK